MVQISLQPPPPGRQRTIKPLGNIAGYLEALLRKSGEGWSQPLGD